MRVDAMLLGVPRAGAIRVDVPSVRHARLRRPVVQCGSREGAPPRLDSHTAERLRHRIVRPMVSTRWLIQPRSRGWRQGRG